MTSCFATATCCAPLLTHRDPLSLPSDDFVKPNEPVEFQLGQLLISHKLI